MTVIERERTDRPPDPRDPILEPRPTKPTHPEFLEAADIIRNKGWCQDHYALEDGSVCLVEACAMAFGDGQGHEASPFYGVPYEVLRSNVGNECLTYWNDVKGRTKEEVIELLERAAYEL